MRLIKSAQEYETALERLDTIFFADEGTQEDEEAKLLVLLVQVYENEHFPIEFPDPIEAIKIRMDDLGLKQKDFVELLGTKSRVSEVLNRKKRLTLEMVRIFSKKLNLPLEVLVADYNLAD